MSKLTIYFTSDTHGYLYPNNFASKQPRPMGLLPMSFPKDGNTLVIDGHNFDEIEAAMENAKATKGKPTAILMKTTKGKCVSFMEGKAAWHGKAPNDAEYEQAMGELKAIMAELEGK